MFYGVDIGETKSEIIAFDQAMQVCWRRRVATPVREYERFLSTITALIDTADRAVDTQGKPGIGIPGLMDRHSGKLLSSNIPRLTGHQVMNDLAARWRWTMIAAVLPCQKPIPGRPASSQEYLLPLSVQVWSLTDGAISTIFPGRPQPHQVNDRIKALVFSSQNSDISSLIGNNNLNAKLN